MWWKAIIASAILAGAGLFGSRALQVQNWLLLFICLVAAGLAGWWQLRIGILSQKSLETSKLSQAEREVYGNLEAAHHLAGFGPGERISLYVPHGRKPEVLVQMVPYVPTDEYGPFRRGIDIAKGITGLCARTRARQLDILKPGGDFRKYMVEQYGFTEAETNTLESDKKSYLAVPVLNRKGKVAGVVFCDSAREQAFTPEAIDLITKVCILVAKYV